MTIIFSGKLGRHFGEGKKDYGASSLQIINNQTMNFTFKKPTRYYQATNDLTHN